MSGNAFLDALKSVFGPVTVTPLSPNSSVVSASGEGVISYNPAWFHGFTYFIDAANTTIDFRLINATASGVNTPVLLNITTLPAGTNHIGFQRPMNFDKGLMWQTTASGTSAAQLHIHWEPGPNPLRGN